MILNVRVDHQTADIKINPRIRYYFPRNPGEMWYPRVSLLKDM